jgi:excisionase family DNA binding protein
MSKEKPFIKIDEASLLTGLSRSTIYKLTALKKLPFYKRGRLLFKQDELLAWIEESRVIEQGNPKPL